MYCSCQVVYWEGENLLKYFIGLRLIFPTIGVVSSFQLGLTRLNWGAMTSIQGSVKIEREFFGLCNGSLCFDKFLF